MTYVACIAVKVAQTLSFAAKGIWSFIGSANILVPIGLFIAEKLLELWKDHLKPKYDMAEFQTLLAQKGY